MMWFLALALGDDARTEQSDVAKCSDIYLRHYVTCAHADAAFRYTSLLREYPELIERPILPYPQHISCAVWPDIRERTVACLDNGCVGFLKCTAIAGNWPEDIRPETVCDAYLALRAGSAYVESFKGTYNEKFAGLEEQFHERCLTDEAVRARVEVCVMHTELYMIGPCMRAVADNEPWSARRYPQPRGHLSHEHGVPTEWSSRDAPTEPPEESESP